MRCLGFKLTSNLSNSNCMHYALKKKIFYYFDKILLAPHDVTEKIHYHNSCILNVITSLR